MLSDINLQNNPPAWEQETPWVASMKQMETMVIFRLQLFLCSLTKPSQCTDFKSHKGKAVFFFGFLTAALYHLFLAIYCIQLYCKLHNVFDHIYLKVISAQIRANECIIMSVTFCVCLLLLQQWWMYAICVHARGLPSAVYESKLQHDSLEGRERIRKRRKETVR